MSYENFVTNYRRQTHFSRSMDEAYRTAEYCSAITVYKSENRRAWEVAKEIFALIMILLVVSTFIFWFLS
jgi:heme oxygenase